MPRREKTERNLRDFDEVFHLGCVFDVLVLLVLELGRLFN